MRDLATTGKTAWLSEAERLRLQALEPGQVWVRSGASGKAVTMMARQTEVNDSLAQAFRVQAQKRLRLTPVKQFCSALASDAPQAPRNMDLYARLCMKETLYAGWFRVKGHNRYSHGNDGVTIEQFGVALDGELDRLASELADGRYRTRPLRTSRIPKPDGEYRVLRIACVRDRVVQAACLQLIEPLFEVRFSPTSFAYRPGRGAHHAVALARAAIRSGKHWVVTADIRKCFDTIDHDILLRLVGDVIGDRDLLQLLRHWLTADIIDFMDVTPSELGVPQGEAISPLLANIYLDPLDKAFEQAGTTFVRYADDYLVLCETEAQAEAALRMMGEFLPEVLRLALKPAKTHFCHVDKGVGFLGFEITRADARIPDEKVLLTTRAVAEYVEVLVDKERAASEKWKAAIGMNALVWGFRNYFLIDNAPGIRAQLAEMDAAVTALLAGQPFADGDLEMIWSSRDKFLADTEAAAKQCDGGAPTGALAGGYHNTGPPGSAIEIDTSQTGSAPGPAMSALSAAGTPAPIIRACDDPADPDVLVVNGRLHVMKSGCYVTISGDDVVVRRRKSEICRKPISDLTMVYLEGKGIALSADLTMQLCEKNVPVVFTPLVGRPVAIAQPIQSMRSNLRQQQVLRRNDPDILKTGLKMLAAKVANQASVLKYFARYRKRTDGDTITELTRAADEVRGIAETLDGLDPAGAATRTTGMGHEGRAAAKYCSSFARIIPAGLAFPGRHTRHAMDPVNSAINYVYTMLYGEVWRAVIRAGLDPYFGIMHGTDRDQGSLVFDLIEEYRAPFGDRVVLGLLGRGFELDLDKEGRLRTSCRRKLVSAFHKQWQRQTNWRGKLRSAADILEQQVASLRNAFLGNEEYRPFRFRW